MRFILFIVTVVTSFAAFSMNHNIFTMNSDMGLYVDEKERAQGIFELSKLCSNAYGGVLVENGSEIVLYGGRNVYFLGQCRGSKWLYPRENLIFIKQNLGFIVDLFERVRVYDELEEICEVKYNGEMERSKIQSNFPRAYEFYTLGICISKN